MDLLRLVKSTALSLLILGISIPTVFAGTLAGEEDGSPSHNANFCYALKFANGDVTNNADGSCSIADQGASSGDSITVDTVAVVNPDFDDGGQIGVTDTANTITWDINDDSILEADLKAVNVAVDEDILTRETATGDYEWHTPAELSLQPLDSELTTIAALTETNGNVMFVAGGAWTSDATPAIDCTDCTNVPGGTETNDLEATDPPNVLDTEFYVGDGAGSGTWVVMSGDATLANTGALTIGASSVGSTEVINSTLAQIDVDDADTLSTGAAGPANSVWYGTTGLIFEGAVADAFEGLLTAVPASSDKTWTLPNVTGTIITTGDTATVDATMLATDSVQLAELDDDANTPSAGEVLIVEAGDATVDYLATDGSGACAAGLVCTGGHTHAGASSTFSWTLRPQQAKFPTTDFMGLDGGLTRWAGLLDDTATDESATWQTVLYPYQAGTLAAKIFYTLETTSTTDVAAFDLLIDCDTDADTAFDTATYGTTNSIDSGAQSLTAGVLDVLTDTSLNEDSCAEFDTIEVKVFRDVSADGVTDDIQIRKVLIYEL